MNSVWQDAADVDPESTERNARLAGLSDAAIARMRELWNTDRVERSLTVLEKFQVALTCADQETVSLGTETGQSVGGLIRLRNDMVHFKPEMQWTDELHNLEKLLRPRIGENPLFDATPWFPLHVLTAGCAQWAYEKARAFGELWWSQMGLTWDAFGEFDSLNPSEPA